MQHSDTKSNQPSEALRQLVRQTVTDMSEVEVLAELARFDPHCCYGNENFRETIQHMILEIALREGSGFERVQQLVSVAVDDYKYLYLISAQELHMRED